MARSIDSAEWISESVALKGDVLQANGQYDAALATYEQNLSSKTHAARRRQARLKMVELGLLMNQSSEVLSRLESMLEEPQPDASLDVVLLTMGEIRLKQYFGSMKSVGRRGRIFPPEIYWLSHAATWNKCSGIISNPPIMGGHFMHLGGVSGAGGWGSIHGCFCQGKGRPAIIHGACGITF